MKPVPLPVQKTIGLVVVLVVALGLGFGASTLRNRHQATTAATTTTVAPTTTTAEPTTTVILDPAQVVRNYFDAINAGDYNTAWELGGKNLGGTQYSNSFGPYVAKFNDIKHIDVKINGGSTHEVSVTVVETHTNGTKITYFGSYHVDNGVITDAYLGKVSTVKPKPPKPRVVPKPKTVLVVNGNGSHTHATRNFKIPHNYGMQIRWSYRASGLFAGESVNFILELRDPDDGGLGENLVNELDTHGSGVEDLGGEGTFWLSVISESSWTLKVIAVPDGCLTDTPPHCP
jgi:hypothetical protein